VTPFVSPANLSEWQVKLLAIAIVREQASLDPDQWKLMACVLFNNFVSSNSFAGALRASNGFETFVRSYFASSSNINGTLTPNYLNYANLTETDVEWLWNRVIDQNATGAPRSLLEASLPVLSGFSRTYNSALDCAKYSFFDHSDDPNQERKRMQCLADFEDRTTFAGCHRNSNSGRGLVMNNIYTSSVGFTGDLSVCSTDQPECRVP